MNSTSGFTHPDIASAASEPRNGTVMADDTARALGVAKGTAPQLTAVFSGFVISLCHPNRGR